MPDDGQERTEQPTSRKREEARKDGNVLTSKEVATFSVILGGFIMLSLFGLFIIRGLSEFMMEAMRSPEIARNELNVEGLMHIFKESVYVYSRAFLPVLILPVCIIVANIILHGLVFTTKPLTLDISKISPMKGLKKIFSLDSVSDLVQSILKIGVLTWVAVSALRGSWVDIASYSDAGIGAIASHSASVALKVFSRTLWVFAIVAVLDYVYQKWKHEKGLRMTKEEVKEETKSTEGDPLVKSRIRSVQREMARRRMMADVPTADVVLTNPTHLAVALKYDTARAGAPYVVAKGAGLVAERIKEIAAEHGVPIVEDKPLARSIFSAVEIGQEIPVDLYRAVAGVLAYVYRLKNRGA
ncbi:MAG: flagellar biosynthesis protein FlhB [Thermodesulfobacteriota bacterium]